MARKKYSEVENEVMKKVAANIKQLLVEKKWNQKMLGEKSGLSSSTISDYVKGKTLISPGNLQKIAEAFEVSKSEIYPMENEENSVEVTEFDSISIEDLHNYQLTYKGVNLTEEQAKQVVNLLRTALDMSSSDS